MSRSHAPQFRTEITGSAEASLNNCPFCNTHLIRGVNKTKEHVLPRWLRGLPALADALENHTSGARRFARDISNITPNGIKLGELRAFRSKPLHETQLTVDVCAACNNEWMSLLEIEASPVLTPLIDGSTRKIDSRDVPLLHRWMGKVMVALEADDPESARAHAAQIRDVRLGRAPRWSHLWVTKWSDPRDTMLRHVPCQVLTPDLTHRTGWMVYTFVGLGNTLLLLQSWDSPISDAPQLFLPGDWAHVSTTSDLVVIPDSAVDRSAIELATTLGVAVAVLEGAASPDWIGG